MVENDCILRNDDYVVKSSNRVSLKNLGTFFVSSFIFLIVFLFDKGGLASVITSICFSAYLLVRFRKNPLLVIIFLLISFTNYSLLFGNYLTFQFSLDYDFDIDGSYRLLAAKIVLFYFYILMSFLLFLKKKPNEKQIVHKEVSNPLLVVLLLLALVFIWIFFYDFSFGSKAGYSPLYEYSTIFFIFAFYYSKKSSKLRYAVLILAAFYVIFDFLGGQRSTGFQIILITFISCFYRQLKFKRILFLSLIALVLVNFVSIFRSTGGFSFSGTSLFTVIRDLFSSGLASDTAYAAYYTSVVFLYVRGFFSPFELFNQFLGFLASQFVIGTVGESITATAANYHWHYYGGILPIYCYYYLGFFGVLLIAFLTAQYVRLIMRFDYHNKNLIYVFSIYVTSSSIRWYIYSPNQLIRGVLLLCLLYFVLGNLNKIVWRKS